MICIAHSSRTGNPCKAKAIAGAKVCRVHGGGAPQVKDKARQRILELAVGPALALLARAVELGDHTTVPQQHQINAARDLLDRAGFSVKSETTASATVSGGKTPQIVIRLSTVQGALDDDYTPGE
jgi:hypothetical protein